MLSFANQLRQVLRRLGRAPAFTAVASLTLALGTGANIAIFSVVDGALLKPPHSEQRVCLWQTTLRAGTLRHSVSGRSGLYWSAGTARKPCRWPLVSLYWPTMAPPGLIPIAAAPTEFAGSIVTGADPSGSCRKPWLRVVW